MIELVMVVAVIGILVAITLPQVVSYRTKALNSAALSDLKALQSIEMGYFASFGTYATSQQSLPAMRTSKGVVIQIDSASATDFALTSRHASGDTTYHVTGSVGQISAAKNGSISHL